MNLDSFCRMCGGLQYLNQQLLQRAQDAKVNCSHASVYVDIFDDDDFDAPAEDVPLMCPLISSGCCSTSMHFICNGSSTRMW
jgi:hypothetical protein